MLLVPEDFKTDPIEDLLDELDDNNTFDDLREELNQQYNEMRENGS
jgi:hypothetical protein